MSSGKKLHNFFEISVNTGEISLKKIPKIHAEGRTWTDGHGRTDLDGRTFTIGVPTFNAVPPPMREAPLRGGTLEQNHTYLANTAPAVFIIIY